MARGEGVESVTNARARRSFLTCRGGRPRAGQHVDVRLVAEDGYQAQRSYSIASAPEDSEFALTVERLEDGEVSPYLCDVLRPGDGLEVRGPIGGYFVWDIAVGGPLLLVAGGSGLVPLMPMLRHHARPHLPPRPPAPLRLLYAVANCGQRDLPAELERRADPPLSSRAYLHAECAAEVDGDRGRIDRAMPRPELASRSPRHTVCVRPDVARRIGSDSTRGARALRVARADGAVRSNGMRLRASLCPAESREPMTEIPGEMPCRSRDAPRWERGGRSSPRRVPQEMTAALATCRVWEQWSVGALLAYGHVWALFCAARLRRACASHRAHAGLIASTLLNSG